jgi:hypothetical protein
MMIAFTFFALAPLPVIEALSGLCCVLFLVAAILRVLSACFTEAAAQSSASTDNSKLPIYTVICPLSREAAIVDQPVGAIRALAAGKTRREIRPRSRRS